jgi:hypothetical protein
MMRIADNKHVPDYDIVHIELRIPQKVKICGVTGDDFLEILFVKPEHFNSRDHKCQLILVNELFDLSIVSLSVTDVKQDAMEMFQE